MFSPDSSTRQVYEEGAKEVALSVVKGINGMTSLVCMLICLLPSISFSIMKCFQQVFLHTDKQAAERHIL